MDGHCVLPQKMLRHCFQYIWNVYFPIWWAIGAGVFVMTVEWLAEFWPSKRKEFLKKGRERERWIFSLGKATRPCPASKTWTISPSSFVTSSRGELIPLERFELRVDRLQYHDCTTIQNSRHISKRYRRMQEMWNIQTRVWLYELPAVRCLQLLTHVLTHQDFKKKQSTSI